MPRPTPLPLRFAIPPADPKKRSRLVFLAFLLSGLAVLGGLAAGILLLNSAQAPAKTASRFYRDLRSGNIEDAWSLASSEFQATVGRENLAKLSESVKNNLSNEDLIVTKRELIKGTAIGTKTAIMGRTEADGRTYGITVELIKDKGEWKIFSFKIVDK